MTLSPQAMSALIDQAVLAYRNREFKQGIESLQQVLDVEPRNWRAKLYLAMCFYHSGEIFTAYRHFAFLKDNCLDAEIRGKAEAAIVALSSQVQTAKMPEMTCTLKTSQFSLDVQADADEVEWVKNDT